MYADYKFIEKLFTPEPWEVQLLALHWTRFDELPTVSPGVS